MQVNQESRIIIKILDTSHNPTTKDVSKLCGWLRNELSKKIKFPLDWSKARISPLFTSISLNTINLLVARAKKSDLQYIPVNFELFFTLTIPALKGCKSFLKSLQADDLIEFAYLESTMASPPCPKKNMNPFLKHQGYLFCAPIGIDAEFAWRQHGGKGDDSVKLINIEQGWNPNHEDLRILPVPLTGINVSEMSEHGSAVFGIINMQDNCRGGIGITPNAKCHIISPQRPNGQFNIADALMSALTYLKFGDVLLLELQVLDTRNWKSLWPLEVEPANFEVIRLATALGITVIEPAGNGNVNFNNGNDLDDFTDVSNKIVLNRKSDRFRESAAIMVAGASSSAPHSRLAYSNYGSRIDCYAWGENIVSAGLFPNSSGIAINTYTRTFGGTSGAAAIIAGAAMALQSVVASKFQIKLDPKQMRNLLSEVALGTPSANGKHFDKIGSMPDLKRIIKRVLSNIQSSKTTGVGFR